jgi:hypothetical protein
MKGKRMPAKVKSLPAAPGPAFVREAHVTQTLHENVYRVRLQGREPPLEITARVTVPGANTLQAGDRVIVAGESSAAGYIIGILQNVGSQAIRTPEGAGAHVHGQGAEQRIAVHDNDGRILFEYHPHSRRSVLSAPAGDLQLAAPDGRIQFTAAKGIYGETPGTVTIRGGESVDIATPAAEGLADQCLRIDHQGARLGVHQLSVTAGRGEIRFGQADFHGRQLRSTVESARLIYGRLEVSAQRLWERSGQAIRQVKELCQVQAGRMRTLVAGAHHMQSGRTTITAREEVRIDGEKINLG